MKNRMTINQLSTYLPFWEEMEKLLNKQIESKEILTEVQSILNRAYMKALKVGFEEGVKNMYSAQDMEAFAEWVDNHYTVEGITGKQLREMWEKIRKEEQK